MAKANLYKIYPGQTDPQPAFVEIDLDTGDVTYDWNGEIGNAVPADVWHERVLCLNLDPAVDTDALEELLESEAWQSYLQTVLEDSEIVWDGSNLVGRLGPEAKTALEAMQNLLNDLPTIEVWQAENWLRLAITRKDGLTYIDGKLILPENLETFIAEYPDEDTLENPVYVYGMAEYLEKLAEENAAALRKSARPV
jgi:hypothetical protein